MSDMIKIAVDAMGGDGSPKKIIDGIVLNHQSNVNVFYKIFGDQKKITPLIDDKKLIKNSMKFFILIMLLKVLTVP